MNIIVEESISNVGSATPIDIPRGSTRGNQSQRDAMTSGIVVSANNSLEEAKISVASGSFMTSREIDNSTIENLFSSNKKRVPIIEINNNDIDSLGSSRVGPSRVRSSKSRATSRAERFLDASVHFPSDKIDGSNREESKYSQMRDSSSSKNTE